MIEEKDFKFTSNCGDFIVELTDSKSPNKNVMGYFKRMLSGGSEDINPSVNFAVHGSNIKSISEECRNIIAASKGKIK